MNRAGKWIENCTGDAAYTSFCPNPLPPSPALEMNDQLLTTLIEANKYIAELNTLAKAIPNNHLFISMYVRKEALLSSQIEGTQCTLEDVLDPESDTTANLDVIDVINYVDACTYALERLKTLPLCGRFYRELHKKLLDGVRGQEKQPGEFRKSQNWIGAAHCSLAEARYVPPNVEDMQQAMDDLDQYINGSQDYDPLIQIALIHYQFETIHPFLDGNGRVGRLLILLYLMEKGLLEAPVIYISYFLKKNQVEYYDRISEVRRTGNYEQWVHFFLEAVAAAAQDSLHTIDALTQLHNQNLARLPESPRKKDTLKTVFDYIEQYPIISIKKTALALGLSYNTISTAVKKLVTLGILHETTNASRNRVFIYEDYLSILRKDTDF